jgi:hypothetical protein
MTGTEKELILLGLFFVVAVNEDSAVVSGAVLSYKHVFPAWQPFVACFLVNCSPKFGQVAKIEKRPENEQQKSWNKAPATA